MNPIIEKTQVRECSRLIGLPDGDELAAILYGYGAGRTENAELYDTSHGPDDIRWNYIIDRRYVLRFRNAPDMDEARLEDLNGLIARYRAFVLKCPLFLKAADGSYFHRWKSLSVYLSEFIDLPVAEETELKDPDALRREVVISIARFMQRYRDVGLISVMGMYSLFDLSPFDIPEGIDEKQQNMDRVCDALRGIGQTALAEKLAGRDREVRSYLLKVYRRLPRCVTQGDENFSNVLIDGQQCLAGLIDFNLAGTDVCANLIANNADFDLDIMHDRPVDAEAVLEKALIGYRRNATVILREYRATVAELEALPYYAWIALEAQYPYACAYIDRIGQDGCRESTLRLLELIAALDLNRLRVEEE